MFFCVCFRSFILLCSSLLIFLPCLLSPRLGLLYFLLRDVFFFFMVSTVGLFSLVRHCPSIHADIQGYYDRCTNGSDNVGCDVLIDVLISVFIEEF